MVRCTDSPAMTIAVDLGRKATKQTDKQTSQSSGAIPLITIFILMHVDRISMELPIFVFY